MPCPRPRVNGCDTQKSGDEGEAYGLPAPYPELRMGKRAAPFSCVTERASRFPCVGVMFLAHRRAFVRFPPDTTQGFLELIDSLPVKRAAKQMAWDGPPQFTMRSRQACVDFPSRPHLA